MTEIEKTNYNITRKAIEIASDIEKLEREMDKVQKVNIYLMRKYRDELLKEFPETIGDTELQKFAEEMTEISKDRMIEMLKSMSLYEQIAKKMNEEMPEPWYCYGYDNYFGYTKHFISILCQTDKYVDFTASCTDGKYNYSEELNIYSDNCHFRYDFEQEKLKARQARFEYGEKPCN